MAKQTVKHFALSLACLGLLMSTPLSLAQNSVVAHEVAAQNEGATPTTESSTHGLFEHRPAHIPPHAREISATDKQTQPPSPLQRLEPREEVQFSR
jgi:hypothetical protein